jgi:hypothetical protein
VDSHLSRRESTFPTKGSWVSATKRNNLLEFQRFLKDYSHLNAPQKYLFFVSVNCFISLKTNFINTVWISIGKVFASRGNSVKIRNHKRQFLESGLQLKWCEPAGWNPLWTHKQIEIYPRKPRIKSKESRPVEILFQEPKFG